MSRRCQVTGREPSFGKSVSHSHKRTSRRWDPNIQTRRYWLASERRHVRLRVSVKGMRTVDKRGIESVVRELRAAGVKV